ncbi:amino acid adenylation domain-containing protein, partial [Bacillus cereus]|nr:amino acid adenylation domain-containing protein [Bacillus cereus]MCU4858157.1 amino acid adenylation domain-containing protein [Bacillus cereus]MCU4874881.1 amino acid adenylation domain-containing protein [Bacillus cereus]
MGFSKQVLLNSGKYQKEKAYWQKKLSGSFHPSRLPRDFKNTKQVKPTTEEIQFKIPDHMFKKIYQITNGSEVGVFLIVATLVNAILYRYSNDEDIVIGIPVFKQKDVGNYINDRLVIRSKLNEDITWKELLTQIQQSVKEANEHQNFPYEEVVKVITDTNFIDNSLYKLLLRFENLHHNVIHNMMEQDLIFSFQLTDIQLLSTIQYRSDLYSTETIKRFFQQFIIALEAFCENTNDKISNLDLITEEEKNQLLYEFNKKSEITDYAQTLHQLFQKSVANHSEQIAIVFNNEKISFQEINKKANQLARKLQDLGVKQRDYVGIMIDNSIEMIIGILSILKAGAAYVPIDPSYPIGRINFMLNDSDIGVLLSSSLLKQQLNKLDYSNKVVLLDSQNIYVGESTDLNLANPDAPAYVIYTSGSTGTPKGVCIDHKSVVQYVNHFIHEFQLNKDDNVLLHSSFAFDASVEQLFPILLVGGRLVVPRKEELMDIAGLKKLIVAQGVSIISCTPLILNEFNKQEELKQVRTFISGGDVLRKEHISNLLTYSTVYNTYGPTEATVCATFYKVKKEDSGKILIGRPIPDKHIYIFDRKEKLVPIGIPGEIYISGRGLSKGYLNQPHLTNENFVDNPFIPGEKMYKTGDIGKWMHDGTIEYIGRIGNQVNIRGYRVELEEIEKNLLNHPAIQEAIVMIQTNTIGNEVLCAYYILNNDLSTVELKNYLREYLPEFMIPTEFIAMDKFPSTVNGKLDYNMLPKPTLVRSNQEHQVKPKNATEKLLVKIWSEVLGIKEEVIGIEDDFFKLGGHSLKATVLIANIFRELQVEIPIREFFQEPTIKNLAFYIQTVRKKEYESIKPLNKQLYYPVSASQNRLLSIAKLDESSVNYNIPGAFLIEGLLNKARFEKAFYSLVQRHESLRTSFRYVEFEAKQVIHENVDYQIDFIYASENELSTIISRFVRAFDLESAPLFKVMLIEINENKHLFLIDIHHIISDGYSVDLMVNEFVQLYKGKELPELHIQYKDYAAWQNNFLKSEIIKKQEQYWLNQFSEEYPVLQLPTDYTRPSVKVYEGDTISVHIGKELTYNMHQIAAEKGMTLFMLLLAAYNILLSKYSDQEDIIVGVPISGRCHPDVGNIIGMFVNTLALRNRPKKDKTFLEFLDEVKKSTLNAFENQDYPFELLVEKLKVQRDTSRNPIFDTMFTFQDSSYSKISIDGLQFSTVDIELNSSKFDLSLYITELEEGLHAQFEYSTELFKKDSIERLSEHFLAILEKITESSNIKLAEIEMINREEEKLLLHDFNQTQYDNHNNTLLHELFEKQVERIPDKVALQFAGRTMTYKELNEQANQLARKIRKLKRQGEEEFLVSVAMERSFEMVKTI